MTGFGDDAIVDSLLYKKVKELYAIGDIGSSFNIPFDTINEHAVAKNMQQYNKDMMDESIWNITLCIHLQRNNNYVDFV